MSRRLRLQDFRDLDLMLTVADQFDQAGPLSTADLAGALGMEEDIRSVAVRMAWMRRFGVFDQDAKTRLWKLSSGGARVVEARKIAAAASTLDEIPDAALVEVMANVTARYRLGDPMTAVLLRREFQFGTQPGSRNGR